MTIVYKKNWAQGRILNNCPVCDRMPIMDGAPVRAHPTMGFLYHGPSMHLHWACPVCGSIFDNDNNLILMGRIPMYEDAMPRFVHVPMPTENID